jgi:hypothetical protein
MIFLMGTDRSFHPGAILSFSIGFAFLFEGCVESSFALTLPMISGMKKCFIKKGI